MHAIEESKYNAPLAISVNLDLHVESMKHGETTQKKPVFMKTVDDDVDDLFGAMQSQTNSSATPLIGTKP